MSTKNDIIKSAIKLFSQYGYYKTTMDMIASEAEVAKGTLYWHFPGKKELFLGIMESSLINYFKFLENIKNDNNMSCQEKLSKIVENRADFFQKHQSVVKEVMSTREEIDEDFKKRMVDLKEKNIQYLMDIIKEGIGKGEFNVEDPYIAALVFMGINIVLSDDKDLFKKHNKEKTIRIIKNMIFKGILSE